MLNGILNTDLEGRLYRIPQARNRIAIMILSGAVCRITFETLTPDIGMGSDDENLTLRCHFLAAMILMDHEKHAMLSWFLCSKCVDCLDEYTCFVELAQQLQDHLVFSIPSPFRSNKSQVPRNVQTISDSSFKIQASKLHPPNSTPQPGIHTTS